MNSEEAWIRKESEKLSFRMHSEEAWIRKEREKLSFRMHSEEAWKRKERERELGTKKEKIEREKYKQRKKKNGH